MTSLSSLSNHAFIRHEGFDLPKDASLAEIYRATLVVHIQGNTTGTGTRDTICSQIISWHADRVATTPEFSSVPHILQNLNKCLVNIGCTSIAESGGEMHQADKANLRGHLTNRALSEIERSASGCLVDAVLLDFKKSLNCLGLPMNQDMRDEMKSAVMDKIMKDPHLAEWQGNFFARLGLPRDFVAPSQRMN